MIIVESEAGLALPMRDIVALLGVIRAIDSSLKLLKQGGAIIGDGIWGHIRKQVGFMILAK